MGNTQTKSKEDNLKKKKKKSGQKLPTAGPHVTPCGTTLGAKVQYDEYKYRSIE